MSLSTRLVAYEPDGPRLGLLPNALTYSCGYPFDDLSSLTLSHPSDGGIPGAELLSRELEQGLEVAVEVSANGRPWVEPRGSRFLLLKRSTDIAQEAGALSLTLPGYGWLLTKARNLKTTGLSTEGKRIFGSATPGSIIKTLLQEAQARGALPGMAMSFDSVQDSAGLPWRQVLNIEYEPGLDVLTILRSLTTQGVCDFSFSGRTFELWNADTVLAVDHTEGLDPTTLRLRRDVAGAPQEESLEDVVTNVLIKGDGSLVLVENNPSAPVPWGAWEGYISQGGVSKIETARVLVQAELERGSRVRGEYTRELIFTEGQLAPLVDYSPGDYVNAPGARGQLERLRVRQVSLGRDADGVKGSLTLNDRNIERELRTTRRIAGIVGGSTSGGGSGALPAPEQPGDDRRLPAAPANLVLDSEWYIDEDGIARASLKLSWTPVTTTDDPRFPEAFEVGGYEIYGRRNQEGVPFTELTAVGRSQTFASYGPVTPGSEWAVKVRAYGLYNNLRGEFSETVAGVVARDTTPPPKPSRLVAVARLGVVKLTWDGRSDTGTGMPRDFSHGVVFQVRDGAGVPIDELRLTGGETSAVVAGLPYATDTQFYLVLYDNAGNPSVPSERTTARVQPLVDTDFTNLKITDAAIVDVDGSKLRPGSVETLRLQVGVVDLIVDSSWRSDALRLARSTQPGTSFVTGYGETSGAYTLRRDAGAGVSWLATSTPGLQTPPRPWIDVTPGSSYWLTLRARAETSAGAGELRFVVSYVDPDTGRGESRSVSPPLPLSTSYNDLRWAFTVPARVLSLAVGVERVNAASTFAHVSGVSMRSRVGGVLIEDGAVTAGKVAALAIEAGKIAANAVTTDNLQAGAVTAVKIVADAVDATRLRADAITAKHTITGATVQTSALNNVGIKLVNFESDGRPPGLYAYDLNRLESFSVDATTGIVRITGAFRSGTTNGRTAVLSGNLQNEGGGLAANQAGIIFRSTTTKPRFGQIYDNGSSVRIDSPAYDTGVRRGSTISADELGVYMYVRGGTINGAAESFQLRNDGFWTLGNPSEDRYGIVRGGYDQAQGNLGFWELRTNNGGSQAVGGADGRWYMGTMFDRGTTVSGDLSTWKIGNSGNQTLVSGDGVSRSWFLGAGNGVGSNVSADGEGGWYLGTNIVRVRGLASGGWELGHVNAQKIFADSTSLTLNGGTGSDSLVFNIGGQFARFQGGTGVYVAGVLAAANKQFVVPHPLDETRWLVHSSTESPHAGVEYWGRVVLNDDGLARVALPPYFEELTYATGRAVLLTPEDTPAPVAATDVVDGAFTVRGPARAVVSWLVKARRRGVDFEVEPLTSTYGVPSHP